MHYIKILRPINLAIVAMTQWLLWFLMADRYLVDPVLEGGWILLFIIDTALIAGAGYVVNDIVDAEIDTINKPEHTFIGENLSISKAKRYYWLLVAVGGILACLIAVGVGELPLLWIYPCATLLLYLYSHVHKSQPLLGNVIVSTFCALVPGMILVAERGPIAVLLRDDERNGLLLLFIAAAYMLFAFLTSMAREIVKDIEDMQGDSSAGHRTLPLVIGVGKSTIVAAVFIVSVVALLGLGMWVSATVGYIDGLRWLSVLLLPLCLLIIYRLYRAQVKKDFKSISRMIKVLMVVGLIVVLILGIPQ